MRRLHADFVVLGSGLAGSVAAYLLSRQGTVLLLSKGAAMQSNSYAAQGGIAAAVAADDHARMHAEDTRVAGAGLCHPLVVDDLTATAPQVIAWLQEIGVEFDRTSTLDIALGLEGAHSRHRILHAGGDATGRKIMDVLTSQLASNGNVQCFYGVHVVSLVQNARKCVIGAVGLSGGEAQESILFTSRRAVILASGGASQLFARSTNPVGATGDGIALAYQVGARIRNMEFMQFHPTALDIADSPPFLISEAVRGAGASLVDQRGERIMSRFSKRDLESRDVVAREMYHRMQRGDQIYLDCRPVDDFAEHFPTISARCMHLGIDPRRDWIPVAPAAHFTIGGVMADMDGQTNVPGLYAIGEVASTGVHGANRLASNSLLECIVMASRLADRMRALQPGARGGDTDIVFESPAFVPDDVDVLPMVKSVMWESAGIVRDRTSLEQGIRALITLQAQHARSAAICTALLILRSALSREESRGAQYRADFPHRDPRLDQVDTVLCNETSCAALAHRRNA